MSASELRSPTVRRLDEIWVGKVRRAMLRLRNVWRNLRLARRYRLRPLRFEALDLRVEKGQVPDCANCQDTCCRGPQNTITLRLDDVARLLDAGLEHAIDVQKPVYLRSFWRRIRRCAKSSGWTAPVSSRC